MTSSGYTAVVGGAPADATSVVHAEVIRGAQHVIAADSGYRICMAAGRRPDVLVGDMDSLDPGEVDAAIAAGVDVARYPATKDVSDLELAVRIARDRELGPVILTGAFSSRLDHTIAALGSLAGACDLCAEAREPSFDAWTVCREHRRMLRLAEQPGTTVSVFAVGAPARVTIRGFRYPLEETMLAPVSSHGLSNVASEDEQTVRVSDGCVIVMALR